MKKQKSLKPLLAAVYTLVLVAPVVFAAKSQPPVFGWIEEGLILPEKVSVKIKLDTGALTSSIDAKDITRFTRNGEKWVKYKVEVKDSDTGKMVSIPFERRIERFLKVRGAGGADHRLVVVINICIGNQVYKEQFSLNNRSKMIYPVLIGRRTIEHLGLVDVSRTFTMEPKCST